MPQTSNSYTPQKPPILKLSSNEIRCSESDTHTSCHTVILVLSIDLQRHTDSKQLRITIQALSLIKNANFHRFKYLIGDD
jgi:hypothetical protein